MASGIFKASCRSAFAYDGKDEQKHSLFNIIKPTETEEMKERRIAWYKYVQKHHASKIVFAFTYIHIMVQKVTRFAFLYMHF